MAIVDQRTAFESLQLDNRSEQVLQSANSEIQALLSLLSETEVIRPEDSAYEAESNTWSSSKNLHPAVVVRPANVASLSKILEFLGQSSLDFNVRTSGCNDASAKHVLISTRAFTEFDFDHDNEILTLGAGSLWSEYYEKMKAIAPEYSIVAPATPFIGVGGSILAAGVSPMSGEYGCTSDPDNMLDAEIVKLDGSVVWASQEPELLWGLRGAQLGLGVVTNFKLRARKYPHVIWGGAIMVPRSKETEFACGLAAMDSEKLDVELSAIVLPLDQVIILNVFHSRGQERGRKVFTWALDIEGTVDTTRMMSFHEYSSLQANIAQGKGTEQRWWNPLALGQLTEELILTSFKWGTETGGMVLYELFILRESSSGPSGSAWPRPSECRHVLVLGVGCKPDASPSEAASTKQTCQDAPRRLLGTKLDERLVGTGSLEDYHNLKAIYGPHWDRIVALKRKYDPSSKLHGTPLARQCLS